MKIIYLYRHPDMGFSIRCAINPIEQEVGKYAEVESVFMPYLGYSFRSLLKNIITTRKAVRGFDIIHITGQENYLIPFLPLNKIVVTIHDLGFVKHSVGLSGFVKRFLFVNSLKFAKYLVCISEKTKDEVISYLGPSIRNTITVIPNCYNSIYAYHPKTLNSRCPRILQVGAMPNKNLARSIEALKRLKCHFRIVANVDEETKKLLSTSGVDYSIVSNLSDAEIVQEYIDCDIVCFPSLYEGFGMPIIEGQAIGRVVVTSDVPPMNKVAGDASVLVDPSSIDSIYKGFIEAIAHSEDYVRKGLENVRRFNVTAISERYLQIYKEIERQ